MPYWIVSVAVSVAMAVVAALAAFGDFGLGLVASLMILLIPLIWISFALRAKRLHDRNKSAWWLLIFYLLPAILDRVGEVAGGIAIVFLVASFALTIWALIELGFRRGTSGPNDYGPDPLAKA
jgi:uncharacterized membrane protein YhaH (DUF805 family)